MNPHPFIAHLRDTFSRKGIKFTRYWTEWQAPYIAQNWARTDLPTWAVLVLDRDEETIPETGETSVSTLWLCCSDEEMGEYIAFLHDEWKGV